MTVLSRPDTRTEVRADESERVEEAELRLVRGIWFALLLSIFFWIGVLLLVLPAPVIEIVRRML